MSSAAAAPSSVRATVASPNEWAFRHRMRFHARHGRLGLFRHGSRELVETPACPVASIRIDALLRFKIGVIPVIAACGAAGLLQAVVR